MLAKNSIMAGRILSGRFSFVQQHTFFVLKIDLNDLRQERLPLDDWTETRYLQRKKCRLSCRKKKGTGINKGFKQRSNYGIIMDRVIWKNTDKHIRDYTRWAELFLLLSSSRQLRNRQGYVVELFYPFSAINSSSSTAFAVVFLKACHYPSQAAFYTFKRLTVLSVESKHLKNHI